MREHRPVLSPEVGIKIPAGISPRKFSLDSDLVKVLGAIGVMIALVFFIAAVSGSPQTVISTLRSWTPFIAKGFVLNVLMSIFAITLGTAGGVLLGMGQLLPARTVSYPSVALTQICRNSPWLVLLFYCIFVLPYHITLGGNSYAVPNWIRASIGFTIPVMANFSEIVRGAVQSIPSGQWEAARSLGYNWPKTMIFVILPQTIKQMLPPWMNLYAILLMATPLASIVGVQEAMANTEAAVQAQSSGEMVLPMYAFLLGWFFLYCYPIARLSVALEKRFEVK